MAASQAKFGLDGATSSGTVMIFREETPTLVEEKQHAILLWVLLPDSDE